MTAGDVNLTAESIDNGALNFALGPLDVDIPGDIQGAYFADPTAVIPAAATAPEAEDDDPVITPS